MNMEPSMYPKPVTVLIIGGGSRGSTYAAYAQAHPDRMRVVGVAEPRDFYRERLADTYDLPNDNVFRDWHEAAARPRFADAVIVATQDAMHADPAVAFASQGYAMLLEKPMAPNEEDCQRIVQAAKDNHILFGVCHVLRYTAYTQALKKIVDSGAIGDVVSIQHLEPVGYWHMAHSFVRGNWRNEQESSPMLLAKSCHDLDWISYIMGDDCRSVSSFGSLKHFRRDQQPAGASERCLDCAVEANCPYSAKKIYLGMLAHGRTGWPVNVVDPEPTVETLTAALRSGPYGRCVYACDNDVVDNQVVNMQFAGGGTAVFTMIGFTHLGHRKTRVFGTRGELSGDGETISHLDFLTDETRTIDTRLPDEETPLGGHGGGDYGVMQAFISAVEKDDASLILSGPDESLLTHRMVFAAERARLGHRVVDL
jgi:predicted dehydrogenase